MFGETEEVIFATPSSLVNQQRVRELRYEAVVNKVAMRECFGGENEPK